jgi:hypothetical protein
VNGGGKEGQVAGGVVDGVCQVPDLRLAGTHGQQNQADVRVVRKNFPGKVLIA